jgi:hypothetical protein
MFFGCGMSQVSAAGHTRNNNLARKARSRSMGNIVTKGIFQHGDQQT